jgi:hypothetical protein
MTMGERDLSEREVEQGRERRGVKKELWRWK